MNICAGYIRFIGLCLNAVFLLLITSKEQLNNGPTYVKIGFTAVDAATQYLVLIVFEY